MEKENVLGHEVIHTNQGPFGYIEGKHKAVIEYAQKHQIIPLSAQELALARIDCLYKRLVEAKSIKNILNALSKKETYLKQFFGRHSLLSDSIIYMGGEGPDLLVHQPLFLKVPFEQYNAPFFDQFIDPAPFVKMAQEDRDRPTLEKRVLEVQFSDPEELVSQKESPLKIYEWKMLKVAPNELESNPITQWLYRDCLNDYANAFRSNKSGWRLSIRRSKPYIFKRLGKPYIAPLYSEPFFNTAEKCGMEIDASYKLDFLCSGFIYKK